VAQEQELFAARIARLHAAHETQPSASGIVGQAQQSGHARRFGYISSLLSACLIGFLAVAVTRLILLHLIGAPDPTSDADIVMLTEGGMSVCLTVMCAYLLRLTGSLHMVLVALGFWAGLLGMHNLVHHHPEGWALLYSERWVWQTTQMTEPNSIYFRGDSIDLGSVITFSGGQDSKPDIKINRF